MRCLILCAGLSPRTDLSTEQGTHVLELLTLPSAGSTAGTWAAKGRGGGKKWGKEKLFAAE